MRKVPPFVGAMRGRWGVSLRRLVIDPYLTYSATLTPVVVGVALIGRRPGEVPLAVGLSAAALLAQSLLGRLAPRAWRRRRVTWSLIRLAVPLLFVGASVQLIGGSTLPLLALFVPVVAGAAAIGAIQGWVTAGVAAVVVLLPDLGDLGNAAVVSRSITLAGVSLVVAFGTHRAVRAHEVAAREARRAAAHERHRRRQIHALEEIGRLLATGGPSEALLRQVVETIASRFGYSYVSIYLGDEALMRLAAQHGYADPIAEFDPQTGVAGRVMRTRQTAFVPDVVADPDYTPGDIGATSLICAPLLVDGQILGLLNIETVGDQRLGADDRAVIAIVSTRVATAVALGRDRQALATRVEHFRDIGAFARLVAASLALESLAQVMVDGLARALDADTFAVTLLHRDSGQYRVAAVRGLDPEIVGREVGKGIGLAGRAIHDRVVVRDATTSLHIPDPMLGSVAVPRLADGVAVPLVRDGTVLGAITVGRVAGRSRFTSLELESLELLASHAVLAVANAMLHGEVEELAIRDSLTGLYNRRYFDEALDGQLLLRQRERLGGWKPLSVIMFDLDLFGAFNKEHGHQVGDEVLRQFADVLRRRFRVSDLVARIGGEEFVAILDGASCDQATAVAEEVRRALAQRRVRSGDGTELQVTVSAGCAELDQANPTREVLLRTADVALFMAKRAGRDRVVAA